MPAILTTTVCVSWPRASVKVAAAGAEGRKLTLKTINQSDRVAACTIIQANLADIGLDVEVVPMDAGPFWNLGLESEGDEWKDLELWLMSYLDSPDPSQNIYPRDEMVAAFGDVGFPMQVGEIGMAEYDEEKSKYGWHIIKRVD